MMRISDAITLLLSLLPTLCEISSADLLLILCDSALPSRMCPVLYSEGAVGMARPDRPDSTLAMLSIMSVYQMITRSDSSRYIASPSPMENALKNGSMLRKVTFTRFLPNECTSPNVN